MSHRLAPAAAAMLCLLAPAGAARADDANTNLYRAAPPAHAYFSVEEPASIPRGAVHAGATIDAGSRLLVVRDPDTQMVAPGGRIVGERLALHLAVGVGVHERLELGAALSTALQGGDDSAFRPALRSTALGDLRLRAKLRAWRRGGLALGALLEASLPTASGDAQFGERTSSLAPAVIAGLAVGRGELAAQLGYRLRGASRVGDLVVDDEVAAGVAARYPVARRVWAQAEVYGALGTRGKGNELERPLEAIGGARVRLPGPWIAQAGVGAGLTRGYGTPALRGLVMIGYAPVATPRPPRARVAWTPPETPDEGAAPAAAPAPAPPPPPREAPELRVVGDRLVLPASVLFALDGDELLPAGLEVLAAVVQLWLEHPEWEAMTVEGHTDVRGDAAANQRLSERRARRVRDRLLELGVTPARLQAVGFGETRPATTGTTEEDHARNRRVEFVITRRKVPAGAPAGTGAP